MFNKLFLIGAIVLLLVSFGVPTQSKSDAVLKSKIVFQDGTNIEVSQNYDGGILFKSAGAHLKKQKVSIAVDDFKSKNKIKNDFIEGWHKDDFGVYTIVQIPITEQGGRLSFDVELSETCVGCATGTTTRTQTGMSNGSWINFSKPINVTTATVTFTGLSGTGSANTTFGTVRIDNYLANGTGIVSFNVSNLTGTNTNSTHFFMNGNLNSDFSNLNVTMDNATKLNIWNRTINGTILIQNGFAQIFVNKTINGTAMNIWAGNTNTQTSSNGSLTFASFTDFCDNSGWNVNRGSMNIVSDCTLKISDAITIVSKDIVPNPSFNIISVIPSTLAVDSIAMGAVASSTAAGLISDEVNSIAIRYVEGNTYTTAKITGQTQSATGWNPTVNTQYTITQYRTGGTLTTFRNDSSLNTISTNVPIVDLRPAISDSAGAITYYDYFASGKVADTSFASFGALNTISGSSDVFVYAIPQNHPMSERKNTSASSVTINLTITVGTQIQNIQLFSNSSTFTGNATLSFTNNTETLVESASGGYYYLNKTVNLSEYSTSIWLNDTITNTTFNNAATKGAITNISSNSNITGTTRTGTYINTSYSALPANTVINLNYTIPYDYLAVLSQPTNQTAGNGSTLTHSITVTDNDYISRNISWDFTNDGIIDAYGLSVQNTYSLNGTYNGTVRVNTSTTIPGWDNQSKSFNTTINNAATITSWGNNQTNNQSLTINLTAVSTLNFNATADQPIDTWSWFVDGVNQSNNANTFNYSFSSGKTIKVNATNNNGTSNTITWTVTLTQSTGITRETKIRTNQINWTAVTGNAYGYVCVYTNRTVYINTTGCTFS